MNDTTTSSSPRRLYRSADDRKIAGVCGGLGDYLDVDPVLFRLAFVLGTVFGGVGLLAYVIAWLVLPERSGARQPRAVEDDDDRRWGGPAIIGAILVIVGILTLLDSSSWFGFGIDGPELFWPLALVGGGAWLLLRERGSFDAGVETTTTATSPSSTGAPAYDGEPGTADDTGLDSFGTGLTPYAGDTADTEPGRTPVTPVIQEPTGPSIIRLTLGVLLVYFGVVALGGLFDWWAVDAAITLAIALLITGVGLVASAFLGRRGWPLLLVGLFLGMALFPATIIDVPLSAGAGERRVTPSSPVSVKDEYQLGFGQLVIDVREATEDLAPGEVLEFDAELGMGQLQVVVPDDVVLDLELDSGIGQAALDLPSRRLDIEDDGWGAEIDDIIDPVDIDETGPEPAVVRVDARVGFGQVVVSDLPE